MLRGHAIADVLPPSFQSTTLIRQSSLNSGIKGKELDKDEKEYLNKGWRYFPSSSLSYNLKVRFAQLFEARTKGGWKYDEISPYLQEFAVRGGMNIEQMLLKYARPVSQVDANGDKVVVYTRR